MREGGEEEGGEKKGVWTPMVAARTLTWFQNAFSAPKAATAVTTKTKEG